MQRDTFLLKAEAVHGNRYTYNNVPDNIKTAERVSVDCEMHGIFYQIVNNHLRGAGCPKCASVIAGAARVTPFVRFLDRARDVHGDAYDYVEESYQCIARNVSILCKQHGSFTQKAANHLNGSGCPLCYGTHRLSSAEFVARAVSKHGTKYNYDLVRYESLTAKVTIGCPIHGWFQQTPDNHLSGKGCKICSSSDTQESFIRKALDKHGPLYDYTSVVYTASKTPVEILCKKHGPFWQQPRVHLSGSGCPSCDLSKGEVAVSQVLTKLGVSYKPEYSIPDCGDIRPFRFDYMVDLPSGMRMIEYHGLQHFEPVAHWGGAEHLARTQHRDKIKEDYCKDRGIPLLVLTAGSDIDTEVAAFVQVT